MTKRRIYFRADASATIGYGHFVRTLALVDMLKDDFECTFFTTSPSAYQIGEMEKVCAFVALQEESKFDDFLNLLKGDEIVVLDNYFFTTEYMQIMKDKGCKLVCMGDTKRHFVSDVLINHAISDPGIFSVEPYTKMCLGFEYALLRNPFLSKADIRKEKGHWFVSFGGTDFDNMTAKFVGLLAASPVVKSITVVIGDAYNYRVSLDEFQNIEIKKNLTAAQMRAEMARAEYAFIPSSTVCIEALACGCKIVSGYFVDNQIDFSRELAKAKVVYPLGDLHNVNNSSFIEESYIFEYNECGDFSEIPLRYINIFKEL